MGCGRLQMECNDFVRSLPKMDQLDRFWQGPPREDRSTTGHQFVLRLCCKITGVMALMQLA